MLCRDVFPWVHDASVRASIFTSEIVNKTGKEERLREVFREAVASTPLTGEESEEDKNAKIACHLSVNYFMANLLARKDRMSMARGLEVRVPFADHRILSYVYNLPWALKFKGGVEKSLLRQAMSPYLPDKILNRKKSPYPKTHNPRYEEAVRKMLEERLLDKNCPLSPLLDRERLSSLLSGEDVTWFGQLMGRPQLLGWLVGLDAFLTAYRVTIV
jgi:asparagine synthase (glutamine-hydrolysing)